MEKNIDNISVEEFEELIDLADKSLLDMFYDGINLEKWQKTLEAKEQFNKLYEQDPYKFKALLAEIDKRK